MIKPGSKVKFHYTLSVDGKVVETSSESTPLEYVHGKGSIIPGLEKELEGLKQGDKKEISVKAKDAYGPVRPEALVEIPKDRVPADTKAGARLTAKSENGETFQGTVRDVRPETVLIDFNHPLAGKDLHFKVEIIFVEMDAA